MADEKALKVVRLVINNAEEVEADEEGGGGGGPGGGGERGDTNTAVFASDDFLALRLSERLGDTWRSTPDGRWFVWDERRWLEETLHRVMNVSRVVNRGVSEAIENAKLARAVTSKGAIYASARLCADDPRHMTKLEDFDADPWILNTPDGIVDLRTGAIRAHDPAALLTRMTKEGARGDAKVFKAFLAEATGGDEELQAFLQRIAGYCLTGSIEEHAIFFLYGPGGTGKSVFLNVLLELMADYATTAPMDIFTVATGERHPAELALLHNVRLVTASETEEGRRWDEAKLKAITGGDRITARFMRGNFFTFAPHFKLLMAGNHRPRMRSADDAMRRRFHVIPFTHKPAKPDKELMEKLRGEFGGILKWAVEGELERRRAGLRPPLVVVAATDEYFEAENAFARWIDERCVKGADETALTKDLYRDFKSWAATTGEYAPSERVFAQKLTQQKGVERWRDVAGARGFKGLAPLMRMDELPLDRPKATTPSRAGGGAQAPADREYREAGEWEADEQP